LPLSGVDITLGQYESCIYLLFHLLSTLAKLLRPGGSRTLIAENLLSFHLAFELDLDKDTVRRVLAVHYKPDPDSHGPSWLTTIGLPKTVYGVLTCSDVNRLVRHSGF
jgi:hypothetical protein